MKTILDTSEDEWSVDIIRTGAFYIILDLQGRVYLGQNAFVDHEELTLPGGGVNPSDKNLRTAAKRETGQEFGRHLHCELIDSRPLVCLNALEDDSWVQHPVPNQKVKLRVGFVVMETSDAIPLQQRKAEVLAPRAYRVNEETLQTLPLRGSTRSLLKLALQLGMLTKPTYKVGVKADFGYMYNSMKALHVPKATRDFHCLRSVKAQKPSGMLEGQGPIASYLQRLREAEQQRERLQRYAAKASRSRINDLLRQVHEEEQNQLNSHHAETMLENILARMHRTN